MTHIGKNRHPHAPNMHEKQPSPLRLPTASPLGRCLALCKHYVCSSTQWSQTARADPLAASCNRSELQRSLTSIPLPSARHHHLLPNPHHHSKNKHLYGTGHGLGIVSSSYTFVILFLLILIRPPEREQLRFLSLLSPHLLQGCQSMGGSCILFLKRRTFHPLKTRLDGRY